MNAVVFLLEMALNDARHGWPTFPVKPRAKVSPQREFYHDR